MSSRRQLEERFGEEVDNEADKHIRPVMKAGELDKKAANKIMDKIRERVRLSNTNDVVSLVRRRV